MAQKEEIKEIVSFYLAKGMSREQIQKALVEQGWPKELARQYSSVALKGVLPLVSVKKISKAFGKRQVLDGVELDVRDGEIVGIIGASGAGKTTLLNTIVGFVEPETGEVIVNLPDHSFSVFQQPKSVKKIFGFATQTTSFYPHLTVCENIEHFASLYDIAAKQREATCNALMKLVGLTESKDVVAQKLSGGMQKRLDIACALVHNPKILILDEPVGDLDPLLRNQMWNMVKAINKRGTTIIIASHFLGELETFCDRIALLRNHKITEFGTPEQLKQAYSENYTIILELASHNYVQLAKEIAKNRALDSKLSIRENEAMISTPNKDILLHIISHIVEQSRDSIINLSVSRPSVNELFESLEKQQA